MSKSDMQSDPYSTYGSLPPSTKAVHAYTLRKVTLPPCSITLDALLWKAFERFQSNGATEAVTNLANDDD